MRRGPGGFVSLHGCLTALIVLLVLLLAATLGQQLQQQAKARRCAAELREFAASFLAHRQRHGAWPPAGDTEPAYPPGMETVLRGSRWLVGTPFGGGYHWTLLPAEGGGGAETGAIALTGFPPAAPLELSARDFLRLDALLDDGDPATGRLRRGFNGWPVYLLRD